MILLISTNLADEVTLLFLLCILCFVLIPVLLLMILQGYFKQKERYDKVWRGKHYIRKSEDLL